MYVNMELFIVILTNKLNMKLLNLRYIKEASIFKYKIFVVIFMKKVLPILQPPSGVLEHVEFLLLVLKGRDFNLDTTYRRKEVLNIVF